MRNFLKELNEQYWLYVEYTNYTMAPWIFGTAVACYLSDASQKVAMLCITFICLWGFTNPKFPPNLKRLKMSEKNEISSYIYEGFMKKNMGLLSLVTRFHVFLFSVICMSIVASGVTRSTLGL